MSGPVDVLAVMDRLDDYYRRHEVLIGPVDDAYSVEHKAARLAVAEFFDLARKVAGHSYTFMPPTQWVDMQAFRAALARVGGAK